MSLVVAATAVLAIPARDLRADEAYQPTLPMPVNVLVISYFPVKGDRIDINQTGDWMPP